MCLLFTECLTKAVTTPNNNYACILPEVGHDDRRLE